MPYLSLTPFSRFQVFRKLLFAALPAGNPGFCSCSVKSDNTSDRYELWEPRSRVLAPYEVVTFEKV